MRIGLIVLLCVLAFEFTSGKRLKKDLRCKYLLKTVGGVTLAFLKAKKFSTRVMHYVVPKTILEIDENKRMITAPKLYEKFQYSSLTDPRALILKKQLLNFKPVGGFPPLIFENDVFHRMENRHNIEKVIESLMRVNDINIYTEMILDPEAARQKILNIALGFSNEEMRAELRPNFDLVLRQLNNGAFAKLKKITPKECPGEVYTANLLNRGDFFKVGRTGRCAEIRLDELAARNHEPYIQLTKTITPYTTLLESGRHYLLKPFNFRGIPGEGMTEIFFTHWPVIMFSDIVSANIMRSIYGENAATLIFYFKIIGKANEELKSITAGDT